MAVAKKIARTMTKKELDTRKKELDSSTEEVKDETIKEALEYIMENAVNTSTENTASTSGLVTEEKATDKKDFKMPEQAEKTLDLYLTKVEEYYNEIGKEKTDIVNQKSKVLEAVLNTDMLKID